MGYEIHPAIRCRPQKRKLRRQCLSRERHRDAPTLAIYPVEGLRHRGRIL